MTVPSPSLFRKRKAPVATLAVPAAFLQFAAPFARVANMIDSLPSWDRRDDSESLRACLPGAWPTVGDVRRLRDEMVRLGWKP